jgi:hypothetical protein
MATKRTPTKPKGLKPMATPPADKPADVTYAVAIAIRAMRDGAASAHQQKLALEWIVGDAAGKRHFPYHGEKTHDTSFAMGRYFVAEQITGLFYVDLASLRRDFDGPETQTPPVE